MLISIVVPVYNAAEHLSPFLDSILAAKTEDMEIILVDDGSTDGSGEIIERYTGVRCLRQENKGPGAARNTGLFACQGDYVAFFDSDDLIDPQAFRTWIQLMRDHPADIWAADYLEMRDGVMRSLFRPSEPVSEPVSVSPQILERMAAGCIWNIWRYVYRRQFLMDKEILFQTHSRRAQDLEFALHALSAADGILYAPIGFYIYKRDHEGSLSNTNTAERIGQALDMLQKGAGYIQSCEKDWRSMVLGLLGREYFFYVSLYRQCAAKERRSVLGQLEKHIELAALADHGLYHTAARLLPIVGIPIISIPIYWGRKGRRLLWRIRSYQPHRQVQNLT